MRTVFIEMIGQLNQNRNVTQPKNIVDAAFDKCLGVDANNNKDSIELGKRYQSRKPCKGKNDSVCVEVNNDSLEEGVISSQVSSSDNESIYETVEKRKIHVNCPMLLTVADFNKDKYQ